MTDDNRTPQAFSQKTNQTSRVFVVRRLMKRVEQLEHPELNFHALHAELLAELDRQRVKGERLAAAAARCAATGKAAVEEAERLAVGVTSVEEGHGVEYATTVQSEVAKDTMPTTMEPAKELPRVPAR